MELDKVDVPHLVITGKQSETERLDIMNKYNSGDNNINTLVISSAGSEGLDLKETRNVIILEPFWHLARNHQVIGRSARYRSHSNLPPQQQTVTVYNLILVPPLGEDYETADQKLMHLGQFKQLVANNLMQSITNNSIESPEANCMPSRIQRSLKKKN
jgi:SNF2 family DNA or RNA helicase